MMVAVQPPSDPSEDNLLAEIAALRQRVAELEQAKQDMEVRLEMAHQSRR